MRVQACCLILAALMALPLRAAPADGPGERCEALPEGLLPQGVSIRSAKLLETKKGLPEACQVRGSIHGRSRFELRLPTTQWNGRYLMVGCGGFCGQLDVSNSYYQDGLRRGYATITTDNGHRGLHVGVAKWAEGDTEARIDFGWRAVHDTALLGKALTTTYYGRDIQRSYFSGCSSGGRQGLMEASRYPEDFDGVFVESPAQDVLGLVVMMTAALQADIGADGKPIFDGAKLPLVVAGAAKACGDVTGRIDRPQDCRFDPAVLQCPNNGHDAGCLSPAEVGVVRRWYDGAPKSALYPSLGGAPHGSEPFWVLRGEAPWWLDLLWRTQSERPLKEPMLTQKGVAEGMLRYLLTDPSLGGDYDPAKFDLQRDIPLIRRWALDMTPSADLSAFRARKGKLVIVQSLGDFMVPPGYNLDYFGRLQKALGGATKSADTARMFLVPGMGHCTNGPGELPGYDLGDYDAFSALERWVEQGQAPAFLPATKRDASGKTLRSEPLCAMPARAVYSGKGDRLDLANWSCF